MNNETYGDKLAYPQGKNSRHTATEPEVVLKIRSLTKKLINEINEISEIGHKAPPAQIARHKAIAITQAEIALMVAVKAAYEGNTEAKHGDEK